MSRGHRNNRAGKNLRIMTVRNVTVEEIQRLDKTAIEKFGVPSMVLMENAGRQVALEVIRQLKKIKKPSVCVICGPGNNAGDGLVAARHLANAGIRTKVFLLGKAGGLKDDALVNYEILRKSGHLFQRLSKVNPVFLKVLDKSDVVVDAIFGVGLNRVIGEPFRSVIEAVNARARYVVAADIPSGLDGTSGKIYGACVKADTTVTFSFAKTGFFKNEGPRYAGKIVVADIGIPLRLKNECFQ